MGSNVRVSNRQDLIDRFALDPFGRDRGTCNGRSTSKCFKLGVDNVALVVNSDLELHDIATGGSAHEALKNTHGDSVKCE